MKTLKTIAAGIIVAGLASTSAFAAGNGACTPDGEGLSQRQASEATGEGEQVVVGGGDEDVDSANHRDS